MLNVPTPILVSSVTLLASAVICLLLEVAGVNEGFKKTGNKSHIALFAFLSVISVGIYILNSPVSIANAIFAFDSFAKHAILFVCLMAVFCLILSTHRTHISHQERGEYYALLLIALLLVIVMCAVKDIFYFALCNCLWILIMTALGACDNYRQLGSEVAVKLFIKGCFGLIFAAFAIVFAYSSSHSTQLDLIAAAIKDPSTTIAAKTTWSFIWILILSFFGIAPFFWFHIDYLDGTSSFSATAFTIGSFIPGSLFLLRLIEITKSNGHSEQHLFLLLWVFAGLSLLIPGFLAMDQRRIARMCIYLLILQTGLWLTSLLSIAEYSTKYPMLFLLFLTNIAFAIPGTILGSRFLKSPFQLEMTWEDYAGVGRKYPFTITAWLLTLASLVGIPGTLGFYIRMQVLQNLFSSQHFLMGGILILSILIGAASVIRLAVFLFAKSAHFELTRQHPIKETFLICLCAFVIILSAAFPKIFLVFI